MDRVGSWKLLGANGAVRCAMCEVSVGSSLLVAEAHEACHLGCAWR